jgi:dienelactone hydrolase
MRYATTIFILTAAALAASAAGAAERIDIKNGDFTLRAMLYRPAAGADRLPAVVAMHGCGGLWTRSGRITPRFDEWGQRLTAAGFVVVFPDSFGSRGLGAQCKIARRALRVSRERVDDANAARRWLQSQSWVNPERVSLIGWSNGATATLWTIRNVGQQQPQNAEFRSAVALYPGCKELSNSAWSARVPTLVLVGGADDWTPAGPCQDMVADARGRSALATIVAYPGAYHDFDRANYPVRQRTGVAFSADGSGSVHLGTNEAARADAIKRVPQWLAR